MTVSSVPECKGQAVCTNGRRCLDAGECLRPFECEFCHRSSDLPRACAECREAGLDPSDNAMRTRVLPRRATKLRVPSAWRVLATVVLKDTSTTKGRRDRLEAARALARLVLEDDDV